MRILKDTGKAIVVAILSWQLRRLQAKHDIKTIGVVGSYGKTSTKFGIATVLKQHYRVLFQEGNYNDIVTVPLVFFGERSPSLLNPIAWLGVFLRNERQIRQPYPYDVVVLELGTDGPGQIAAFGRYLQLDVAVLTSIAYEHMEFFTDLQAVADEELAVRQYSKQLFYNSDLCGSEYELMYSGGWTVRLLLDTAKGHRIELKTYSSLTASMRSRLQRTKNNY